MAGYDHVCLGGATVDAGTNIYIQIFLSHENNADLCGVKVTEVSTSIVIVTASTGANQASPQMRGPNTVSLGAGVGVGLGIPLLLGCIALGFYVRRHRHKGANTPPASAPLGLRGRGKMDVPVGGPGGAGLRQEMDNDRDIHGADHLPPRYTP